MKWGIIAGLWLGGMTPALAQSQPPPSDKAMVFVMRQQVAQLTTQLTQADAYIVDYQQQIAALEAQLKATAPAGKK